MKFSIAAFAITICFVIAQGLVSLAEGTFTNRRVTMGFVNHGGMWGDLFLLSVVNGLLWPHFINLYIIIPGVIASYIITVFIHWQWEESFRWAGITCHMFPGCIGYVNSTRTRVSRAGALHVIYMTLQITLLIMYIISPIPEATVLLASMLLTAHVFLGTVQPGWYCTRELWTRMNMVPPVICTVLIWLVASVKLHSSA